MKAVIFDLDDTLFDHSASAVTGLRAWVPELGVPWSDELIAHWFAIERIAYDGWLSGRTTHQGQRRARLRAFLPLLGQQVPAEDAELDDVFAGYLRHYEASWSAFPDARPAVEVARSNGWRVGVLTNGSTVQQNKKLAAIGLAPLVDVVATTETLGCSKPAPEAYLLTCRQLGVDPADTLMIGDNLELDVLGARAAGLAAEHLDRAAGVTLAQLVPTS
ncbi:HAD-superfamily hydrolase, subfamily IA, variant 1 [Kribbella flavida DSM 17836]|uniref:HAD-superfamily hydrolase, subfamily IA, variant 1 n=1 Tax=Kribbella flavida (strain DSM 17836 / JCM 10339 / NBRC 14399) TaxID=479435 RepID=D2PVN5_KRIFD|nr:HAD family hydrolase [Kribbella flavida]ADB35275.1 HAD-superfamily hydrolase, subfamily IA, variant 1 [Kribbella flavida DSM 17836]